MLRQYFDQVWFLPPDTMGYKYSVTNSKVCTVVWYLSDLDLTHRCNTFLSISGSQASFSSKVHQCLTSGQNVHFLHAQKIETYLRSEFSLLTKRVETPRDKIVLKSHLWSIENENSAHGQKLRTN